MDINEKFKELEKLSVVDDEDEEEFFDIIDEIEHEVNLSHIKDLCKLFDNNLEKSYQGEAIMNFIFEIIDRYDVELGLHELINNFCYVNRKGSEYLYYINKLCLNSYEDIYLVLLKDSSDKIKEIVKPHFIQLLEFGEKVEDIVKFVGLT